MHKPISVQKWFQETGHLESENIDFNSLKIYQVRGWPVLLVPTGMHILCNALKYIELSKSLKIAEITYLLLSFVLDIQLAKYLKTNLKSYKNSNILWLVCS